MIFTKRLKIDNYIIVAILSIMMFCIACGGKHQTSIREAWKENRHIADSILMDDMLKKVIVIDSGICIDSIVYKYEGGNHLKSVSTYIDGKEVESAEFENNAMKYYSFLDFYNKNIYYKVRLDSTGIAKRSGTFFFQIFADKIDPTDLSVQDNGERMHLSIFVPSWNKCYNKPYVLFEDSVKGYVFKQNPVILNLFETWIDTKKKKKKWTSIDINIEDSCNGSFSMHHYGKVFYYKIRE